MAGPYPSTEYTAQQARKTTRSASPSFRTLQSTLRYAVFNYTFVGTEDDEEIINLGVLGVNGARVIPELSRIRDTGGAQDIDVSMKLNALIDGETSTDLSGTVALDNNSVVFTPIAAAPLVELDADDLLRLIVDDDTIGAVTAGETITVEIAYFAPDTP